MLNNLNLSKDIKKRFKDYQVTQEDRVAIISQVMSNSRHIVGGTPLNFHYIFITKPFQKARGLNADLCKHPQNSDSYGELTQSITAALDLLELSLFYRQIQQCNEVGFPILDVNKMAPEVELLSYIEHILASIKLKGKADDFHTVWLEIDTKKLTSSLMLPKVQQSIIKRAIKALVTIAASIAAGAGVGFAVGGGAPGAIVGAGVGAAFGAFGAFAVGTSKVKPSKFKEINNLLECVNQCTPFSNKR